MTNITNEFSCKEKNIETLFSNSLTLLIISEKTFLNNYKNPLSNHFSTVTTTTQKSAAEIISQHTYDVILLEVNPFLFSLDLIAKIRSQERNQYGRIILLASRQNERHCLEGMNYGANDYLLMPFSSHELLLHVETQLQFVKQRSTNDSLTHLHQISQCLRSEYALSSLLQAMVKACVEFAWADMGNIQLYDSLSHVLHAVSDFGFDEPMQQYLALTDGSHSVFKEAINQKRPIHISPIEDSDFYQNTVALTLLKKSGICSIMTIPVIAYGRIMGVITLYWKCDFHPDNGMLKILDLLTHETANLIQHRQNEEILQAQKIKAEENSHAKDLFLATLSHELRSPLTAILTWAQLLKTNFESKEKLMIGLNAIEDSAMTQNTIINDLMDISGTILGKITLEMQPTDLNQLLKISVDSMRASAEKKSLAIDLSLAKSLIVSCDPVRIKQVFSNLLANAIKFTPEGGKITIESRPFLHDRKPCAEIIFSDNGKGIKKEFLSTIFLIFHQGLKSREGFGLGLALAHNLIKLHGGTIRAESEGENRGASFIIRLPLL